MPIGGLALGYIRCANGSGNYKSTRDLIDVLMNLRFVNKCS